MDKVMRILLKGIARLPFCILYAAADVVYFVLYHMVRYRRKAVRENLRESFPEKTPEQLRSIERQFYRNFADYIVETIKLLHISDEEMRSRMTFEGVEMIDEILASGQSIAAYFSHCFNWELAPSVTLWSRFTPDVDAAFCQVYRPLRSHTFDRLMLLVRSRFNPRSLPKQTTLRTLLTLRREGMPSITGFMSDQKPSHGDPTCVVRFLNHPTAMITGTETLARRLGMAAIYWDMEKTGRGHYKITCRMIARDLSTLEPMAVTKSYARMLEETIRRNPSIWLWSHKRWKWAVKMPENEA